MKREAILTGAVFALLVSLFVFAANDWRLPWAPERPPDVEWCEAHDAALADCAACDPAQARGGTRVVQLREPDEDQCVNTCMRIDLGSGVAERIGIQYVELKPVEISENLEANAEARYPPDKYARVAPRITGVIRKVQAVMGQEVSEGDVLALLDSPEFGRAKSRYLQALALLKVRQKTFESEKTLYPKITTRRQMMEAEAALVEGQLAVERTRQRLATLGLSEDEI
ncbi:MAG: efflux RND transporter periplasmic adaptor subunit, partial [Planctomycetota bacterium]